MGKRILFFSAILFGYQEEITKCMERKGYVVDYFDERPANTFFVKAMIRINRNFLAGYIDKYHQRIIEQTKFNKYDYIFITKGESISLNTIKKLRKSHPESKIIIYHWDSIANNKNAILTLPFFDKVYSFDKHDCNKFKLTFLPLFYLDEYKNVGNSTMRQDIDLSFIGTAHSDRYCLLKRISEQLNRRGLKSFFYIYFPAPILYYRKKLTDRTFRGTNKANFQFESIKKEQVIEIYMRSRIIVDIQHPKQTGLTMRTIEVLGAKRKLITTNTYIKEYDFYDSDNILVIDRNNPVVTADFLNSEYRHIPNEIYEKYSINNWIKKIFE